MGTRGHPQAPSLPTPAQPRALPGCPGAQRGCRAQVVPEVTEPRPTRTCTQGQEGVPGSHGRAREQRDGYTQAWGAGVRQRSVTLPCASPAGLRLLQQDGVSGTAPPVAGAGGSGAASRGTAVPRPPPGKGPPDAVTHPRLCQVASSASQELQGLRDAVTAASALGPEAPGREGPSSQRPPAAPAPPAPRTTASSSSDPLSDLVDARQALMDAIRSGPGAARLRKVRGGGRAGGRRGPAGVVHARGPCLLSECSGKARERLCAPASSPRRCEPPGTGVKPRHVGTGTQLVDVWPWLSTDP